MSREGSEVAGSLRCSSALPSAVEGRGGATRRLYSSVGCGTLVPWVITARILRSAWENAHGLGAGAVIAVLRGRCAERNDDAS